MAITERPVTVRAEQWLAESIRATVFPAPGVSPAPDAWWRELTGGDPETRTLKPATREHVDEGPFVGGLLRLAINPLGIMQWDVRPAPPRELPTQFPVVGPLGEILPSFAVLVEKWFTMAPPASRIAFGAVTLLSASGHREAYAILSHLLRKSVNINADRSSELLYRINRPRASTTVPGLDINRLTTWSALKMMLFASVVGEAVAPERLAHESFACRVEVDVNTAPTFQATFDSGIAGRVFEELRRLATEIIEQGDI